MGLNKTAYKLECNKLLEFDSINLEIEKGRCLELKNMHLDQLPIYNWYINEYIDENFDLLTEENPDMLIKKLDQLSFQLDKEKLRMEEIKKSTKLYGKKIIRNAMEQPATKKFLDKD
jgi:hypothetical protein